MLGLFRTYDGVLHRLPSPYSGAKILAGASAGEAIFYDPDGRLDEVQYGGCISRPVDEKKWEEVVGRLLSLERIFALGVCRENGHLKVKIDGHLTMLLPDHFRWVLPKGELEGYH